MSWLLLAMLSCGEEPECSEEVPCGFGESCVDGSCVASGCSSSEQCGMEQHCEGGRCTDGCAEDTDCYPGDACDTESSSCVLASCRDSHLDCAFKEWCNPASGECYEAAGYYCMACVDDGDCGGNGNLCLNFGSGYTFCGVSCEVESDCPSGFTCIEVDNGGIPVSQCITYCWLYEDSGRRSGGGLVREPHGWLAAQPVCEAP